MTAPKTSSPVDAAWTDVTVFYSTEPSGRVQRRTYLRARPERPGQHERRVRLAAGQRWCRGCADWLPVDLVERGVCRPCANDEYRARYAADGSSVRAQKSARKRGLGVIPAWWRKQRLTGPCLYGCGRPATTLDHIWPVKRGGDSRPGNLAPACGSCNSAKRDRLPRTWVWRGISAFPAEWVDLMALALKYGADEWVMCLHDGDAAEVAA